jgi:hypothetical protein
MLCRSSRRTCSLNGWPTLVFTTLKIRSLGTCAFPETSTLTTVGPFVAGAGDASDGTTPGGAPGSVAAGVGCACATAAATL